MKALFQRFAAHPEFAFPGLLMLGLSIAFGISTVFLRDDLAFWLLATLTFSTGVALLLKTRVGTALLIATVLLNLCHSAGGIGWSGHAFLSLALGLAFTTTMALFVLMQFQFHKSRGPRRPDAFVLPPQN